MKKMSSKGNMHEGMSRKCPPGDSGMRPKGPSVDSDATRSGVAQSHSIGGRVA
jgi:hypothetical protein